ncbi:LD-carboxypeptidase, partial [Deltaproteobacteria bacterium OttesenSCG-928-K17]|nr:LD-carboxypeptidase [Deltaproteobacteria bacterium OttesenSCG-928-K17]
MKKYGFYKLSPLRGLALMLIVIAALCATGLAELGAEPNSAPQAALPDDADFKAELNKWGRKGTAGIFVVAPASGLKGDEAKRAYAMAEKLGVRFSEKTLSPDATPYNANSDKIRLELLAEALTSPDVEVVWALRGGYGSSRLLAELALKMPPQAAEKTFIGYSDMTFLHLFLQSKGWRTIHGAMFWDLDSQTKDEENFKLLAGLLAGRIEKLDYSGL